MNLFTPVEREKWWGADSEELGKRGGNQQIPYVVSSNVVVVVLSENGLTYTH